MSIITISRGTFGGGTAVAEELAKQLGYSCVSREMVTEDAAKTFGIQEKELHDTILETPGIFGKQISTRVSNLKYLRAALLERCKDYRIVYHGWAGHLLLEKVPRLMRVRITAGIEYRIKGIMENKGIKREKAISLITAMDKNRTQWARALWGVEWDDPSLYDLALNLDTVSLTSAVKTILQFRELEEFKETAETRQAFQDQYIVSKIWVALLKNKPTRGVRIAMTAENGHITITGDVGSMKMANAVVYIAENIEGVKGVTNNIGIGSSWMW